MSPLKREDICGAWTLESFDIESTDQAITAWGKNTHGLLIYSETGHMSVSINKKVENDPEQNEAQNIFDSILFYSGTWKIKGDLITHFVKNASNPARIGKEMVRYGHLSSSILELTTPQESFGRAIIRWKKIIA